MRFYVYSFEKGKHLSGSRYYAFILSVPQATLPFTEFLTWYGGAKGLNHHLP